MHAVAIVKFISKIPVRINEMRPGIHKKKILRFAGKHFQFVIKCLYPFLVSAFPFFTDVFVKGQQGAEDGRNILGQ